MPIAFVEAVAVIAMLERRGASRASGCEIVVIPTSTSMYRRLQVR